MPPGTKHLKGHCTIYVTKYTLLSIVPRSYQALKVSIISVSLPYWHFFSLHSSSRGLVVSNYSGRRITSVALPDAAAPKWLSHGLKGQTGHSNSASTIPNLTSTFATH